MIELDPTHPVAELLVTVEQALASGDIEAINRSYESVLRELQGDSDVTLRHALELEHVSSLVLNERHTEALARLSGYLAAASNELSPHLLDLRVLEAEIYAAQGRWGLCEETVSAVKSAASIPLDGGVLYESPGLTRLTGLLAAEREQWSEAAMLVGRALDHYLSQGDETGRRLIESDVRRILLVAGDPTISHEDQDIDDIDSISDLLVKARTLKRAARYEKARNLIASRLKSFVDPPRRFPLLHEYMLLSQLMGDRDAVKRMLPLLEEAAPLSGDPESALESVERLRQWQTKAFQLSTEDEFSTQLHNVRTYVQRKQYLDAERLLQAAEKEIATPVQFAFWSLTAGETRLGMAESSSQSDNMITYAEMAAGHLYDAATASLQSSLPDVYRQTLRLIGRLAALRRDSVAAVRSWAEMDRFTEIVAHRQETDKARILYLESTPSSADELISYAASQVQSGDARQIAAVAVAMEMARGAAILSSILPADSSRMRDVPNPFNPEATMEWYDRIVSDIPRDSAIWMLHASPDDFHHAILGHNTIRWTGVRQDRRHLLELVEQLLDVVENVQWYLGVGESDNFSELVRQVSSAIHIEQVTRELPKNIRRLFIVAGDFLGNVPFAALPIAESPGTLLIHRYAVSELPCVSAYTPLARRARSSRGDRAIEVQPPEQDLSIGRSFDKHKETSWLMGDAANKHSLMRTLEEETHQLLRFDCHGKYDASNAERSWLKLAPDTSGDERLLARELKEFPLSGIGTLMLGACESGMHQRRGRDERIGFVRAGLAAGSSSVVAARWAAEDTAATFVLNRCQEYMRFLTRDQALRSAQLDWIKEVSGQTVAGKDLTHPLYWACWTLFGDPGLQTNAGWVRRQGRKMMNRMRIGRF